MQLLDVRNIKKIYKSRAGGVAAEALKSVSFSVEKGEFVTIMGESGSGKTTLLNILAGLDKQTAGSVLLNGRDISTLQDSKLSEFRRDQLGFVFQEFNLLDSFNVEDNILLPLVLRNESLAEMHQKLLLVAEQLKIEKLLKKYPYEISGGQKQRTAVARAIITKPQLILADEPTGALDSKSSSELMEVFRDINQSGHTILMVTHSAMAASCSSRVLFIKDGEVFHQLYRGNLNSGEFYERITSTLTMLSKGGARI